MTVSTCECHVDARNGVSRRRAVERGFGQTESRVGVARRCRAKDAKTARAGWRLGRRDVAASGTGTSDSHFLEGIQGGYKSFDSRVYSTRNPIIIPRYIVIMPRTASDRAARRVRNVFPNQASNSNSSTNNEPFRYLRSNSNSNSEGELMFPDAVTRKFLDLVSSSSLDFTNDDLDEINKQYIK